VGVDADLDGAREVAGEDDDEDASAGSDSLEFFSFLPLFSRFILREVEPRNDNFDDLLLSEDELVVLTLGELGVGEGGEGLAVGCSIRDLDSKTQDEMLRGREVAISFTSFKFEPMYLEIQFS